MVPARACIGAGQRRAVRRRPPPCPRLLRNWGGYATRGGRGRPSARRGGAFRETGSDSPRAAPTIGRCRPRCWPPSCSRRHRRAHLVARPRLLEQLDTSLDGEPPAHPRVRTSRLRQDHRAQRLARPPRVTPAHVRVGWLSLDEDDNDLTRLLTHVVAALTDAGLDVDPRCGRGHPGTATSDRPHRLVNDVARAADGSPETQWVLVLDDYHAHRGARRARGADLPARPLPRLSCTW